MASVAICFSTGMFLPSVIAWLSTIVAFGGIVIGFGVLIPALRTEQALVDINLAHALAFPLIKLVATIIFVATVVLCCVVSRWISHRFALTLALINLGILGLNRIFLIPKIGTKWTQVDLLTQRPSDTFRDAQLLWNLHSWLATTAALIFLVMVLFASRQSRLTSQFKTSSSTS